MAKKPTKKEQTRIDDLIKEMRENYDTYVSLERHNTDNAIKDLRLLVGEGHWDATVEAERKQDGRPCLVVNQLPVFTRQVIGDQRKSRPATKIIPADSAASPDIAELIEGMVREIKYKSKSDSAHDTAFGQAVRSGFGYWRIKTDYASDGSFDQTVYIESIPNQFGVKVDPYSVKWDKTDAGWCSVETVLSKRAFKDKYPGHEPTEVQLSDIGADWYNDSDGVRVVEYFKRIPKPKTIYQMESGIVLEDEAQVEELKAVGDNLKQERIVDSSEIVRYLMCGFDLLEDAQVWPSTKYFPIIEVLGETVNINGKVYKRSLIRDSHDSQKSFNYAISSEVETFALVPKAPIMVTPKQVQGFEGTYRIVHKRTLPYLPVNSDPSAPGWPMRIEPPQLSSAMVSFRAESKQNLRDTMGIFDASLGNKSNEISGVAIGKRQAESDTGTYIWMDNLQYALELEDRVILDILPKIYDTNRMVMTRGVDGTSDTTEINKPAVDKESGTQNIENDLTKGRYDVQVTLGPSYANQRQEAKDNMIQLIQAVPNLAPFVADKLVRAMDFQDAQDIALRLTKGIVPRNVLTKDELTDLPQEPEQGPDPLTMAQIGLAESQMKVDMAKVAKSMADVEKIKAEIGQMKDDMVMKVLDAVTAKLGGMVQGQTGSMSQNNG